jgi:hypothetical protein
VKGRRLLWFAVALVVLQVLVAGQLASSHTVTSLLLRSTSLIS